MWPPMLVRFSGLSVLLTISVALSASAVAQSTGSLIYVFPGSPNCGNGATSLGEAGPLIADTQGNLYGTTLGGGDGVDGCVFELSPTGGGWTESVLWTFNGADGAYPWAALVLDDSGNLYGTTSGGGAYNAGTVFELSPGQAGWTETVLHSFGSPGDGVDPVSNLIFGPDRSLYGTTFFGGIGGGGVVFKLTPGADGWTETILYSSGGKGDGHKLIGGLVMDRDGTLYGCAEYGGVGGGVGNGAVYALVPYNGGYQETIIHDFSNFQDGRRPNAGLTLGPDGALYGTTVYGGYTGNFRCANSGCGVIFRLAKDPAGNWNEQVLRQMHGYDGWNLTGSVVFDPDGNLYAAAQAGGVHDDGSVFMLTPSASGEWHETMLYSFSDRDDGAVPYAGVIFVNGSIFGMTSIGGAHGQGTVFEFTPPPVNRRGAD
jgi:uncharacterized repeat protein (TIGR03803 family)